jgi:glycosyltransferase involved in cell wall biosynthesis
VPTDTHPTRAVVIVCAHDEQAALPATLAALADAFPDARVVVADDASTDATPEIARAAGVEVVRPGANLGKGGAATLAARHVEVEARSGRAPVFVLCDADLGESARHLARLADEVRHGRAALAVGAFERRVGGGFGVALSFARWAIRRRCGLVLEAPISGQRALSGQALLAALPFAPRFGMEIGMTVDVARAGLRVVEVELPLSHRVTGRTWRGFVHRAHQLADFVSVYLGRR